MTLAPYVCWNHADADQILRLEALEGRRSIFLATHESIENLAVEGPQAVYVQRPATERALLKALEQPDLRHAFCVIEGEPGTGKSHLIRWMSYQWQQKNDLVILVPRSDGSLEGALRCLRGAAPAEFRDLFRGGGSGQEATLAGRARDLLTTLANSFAADYFQSPPADAEWAAKTKLNELFLLSGVLGAWKAPSRILHILTGAGGQRNAELARFTVSDVHDLAELLRAANVRPLGQHALLFTRRLIREADEFNRLAASRQGQGEEEMLTAASPNSALVVAALNARLNNAVRSLLKISDRVLIDSFDSIRRTLRKRGMRLVLLLEDVASYQGVEDQIVEMLITRSTTDAGDERCDLIGVIGITPAFYKNLVTVGNVRQRITLHVRFTADSETGTFQETEALRTTESRTSFVATYLRAIRAGTKKLEDLDVQSPAQVPNICTTCPRRVECFEAFGEHKGGGLYPLTREAIDHIYGALADPKGAMTLQTPRGMVQGVLAPLLQVPDLIMTEGYPPQALEGGWIPRSETTLLGPLDRIVQHRVADEDVRERVRRTIIWWGRRDDARTTADGHGQVRFADVPRGIFDAFALPWLGEQTSEYSTQDVARGANPPVVDPAAPAAPEAGRSTGPAGPKPKGSDRPPGPTPVVGGKHGGSKGDAGDALNPAQLKLRREQLATWAKAGAKKGDLPDPDFWSGVLMSLLDGLPWRMLGVSLWEQEQLFTKSSVRLEGSTQTTNLNFVVPREEIVRAGLDAYLVLRARSLPEAGQSLEFFRRSLAGLLGRLSDLVRERLETVKLVPAGAGSFSPVASAAQLLLVRAWLRGDAQPDQPLAEQWTKIVTDENDNVEASGGRGENWTAILRTTGQVHVRLRELVRFDVRLPQSSSTDLKYGLVDAGEIAPALVRLHRTGALDPIPEGRRPPIKAFALLASAADNAVSVRSELDALLRHEPQRVRNRVEKISIAGRDRALGEYFSQVERVVADVMRIDTQTAAVHVQLWRKTLEKLKQMGAVEAVVNSPLRRVDGFLLTLDPNGEPGLADALPTTVLSWLLTVPAADLTLVAECVDVASATVKTLLERARSMVGMVESEGRVSLVTIQAEGARIVAASTMIKSALKGGG